MAGILRRAPAPARAVQRALDPGRDRPGAPPRPVPQPPGRAKPALAREARAVFVQGGVLAAQAAERAAIAAAVGGQPGGAVAAVRERHRLHPASAPAVREGVDPQLPVLELLEGLIEASRRLDHLTPDQRAEPDRVAVEEGIGVIRREAQLPLPVAEE